VPWQAGVCHAGHRDGSTAGLARAPQAKLRFFDGLITTPRDAKSKCALKCSFKCTPSD